MQRMLQTPVSFCHCFDYLIAFPVFALALMLLPPGWRSLFLEYIVDVSDALRKLIVWVLQCHNIPAANLNQEGQ